MKLSYEIDMAPESEWLIVSPGAATRNNLPYVQEAGDFIAREKYFTSREGLPSYLIKYTLSGEGHLVYEGQDVFLPQGSFYWIDCQKPQDYRTSERIGKWHVIWVHFYGAECEYLYKRFLTANGVNFGELPANNKVAEHIYELIDLYRGVAESNADVRAAALLVSIMSECICGNVNRADAVQPIYVRKAQDYIALHFREQITLELLSKEVSINKYYLQKLFSRHVGLSPNAYLTALRIARAKELLRMTEMPVSVVATETGIETVSHFIKIFREHEGITPAQYRRIWKTKDI